MLTVVQAKRGAAGSHTTIQAYPPKKPTNFVPHYLMNHYCDLCVSGMGTHLQHVERGPVQKNFKKSDAEKFSTSSPLQTHFFVAGGAEAAQRRKNHQMTRKNADFNGFELGFLLWLDLPELRASDTQTTRMHSYSTYSHIHSNIRAPCLQASPPPSKSPPAPQLRPP